MQVAGEKRTGQGVRQDSERSDKPPLPTVTVHVFRRGRVGSRGCCVDTFTIGRDRNVLYLGKERKLRNRTLQRAPLSELHLQRSPQ